MLHGSTLVRRLRPIDEGLLIFRATDYDSPGRVEQTCHQHLAVLERITAGDAAGALIAIERKFDNGRAIVNRAIANAQARSCLGRARDIEICRAG